MTYTDRYTEYSKQKIKEALEKYEQGQFKVWAVTADYCPKNEHKPKYYIIANSAREAKRYFKSRIDYLKIYECVEVSDDEAKKRLSDPFYIMFNYQAICNL